MRKIREPVADAWLRTREFFFECTVRAATSARHFQIKCITCADKQGLGRQVLGQPQILRLR